MEDVFGTTLYYAYHVMYIAHLDGAAFFLHSMLCKRSA